jgi:drug/metabolite transporter (DMT)-like permease
VLLALAAIWGASFLFIKVALRDVGPLALVACRVTLGALGVGSYLLGRRGRAGVRALVAGGRPVDALLLGLTASGLPFLLISWAETRITSSLAGILNASLPLVTAVLLTFVDPEHRLRGWRSAGLVVGFAGVATVAGADVGGSPLAIAAMLAAVTCYAIGAHLAKRRMSTVEPVGVALVQQACAAVLVLPIALAFGRPDHVPHLRPALALLALGLGGTALAFCLFYWLLARTGPQHTVTVTYLAPVFAVFYGATILDERIGVATVVGMVVIIAGELLTAAPERRSAEPLPEAVT